MVVVVEREEDNGCKRDCHVICWSYWLASLAAVDTKNVLCRIVASKIENS